MKKLLFVALTSLVATSAYADKWVFINDRNDFLFVELLNKTSVITDGNIRDFWVAEVNVDKTKKHDLLMTNIKANCKTESLWFVGRTLYRKGEVLDSYYPPSSKWQRVLPGSVGQAMVNEACGNNKNSKSWEYKDSLADFTSQVQGVLRYIKEKKLGVSNM